MQTEDWYAQLVKPTWSPPAWLFGPVWTILYTIIAISFGTLLYKIATKQIPSIIALPLLLNIFFNLAFTPIQFGLRNNALATVDILLVIVTLVWAFATIWFVTPELRWTIYINVPYLLWGLFATVLQITITFLNK